MHRARLLFLFSVIAIAALTACKKTSNFTAEIETNRGVVKLRLLDETPAHRDNFVKLAREGYFNNMLFHRVLQGFVIQAGDPNTRKGASATPEERADFGKGEANYTLAPEIVKGFYHTRGAVGAARDEDAINPDRRSSGSHFYIVCGGNGDEAITALETLGRDTETLKERYRAGGTPHLDGAYTIFGYVTQGMEVVDQITTEEVNEKGLPVNDIVIKNIKIK